MFDFHVSCCAAPYWLAARRVAAASLAAAVISWLLRVVRLSAGKQLLSSGQAQNGIAPVFGRHLVDAKKCVVVLLRINFISSEYESVCEVQPTEQ